MDPVNVNLDAPPPQPPKEKSKNLMQARMESPEEGRTGMEGSHPAVISLRGLAMVRDGFRILGSALPNIAPMLNMAMAQLEQLVPQEMANAITGAPLQPTGAVAPMPPQPMGAPPPQTGALPA